MCLFIAQDKGRPGRGVRNPWGEATVCLQVTLAPRLPVPLSAEWKVQKRASAPLRAKLQKVVSCHVDAEN